MTKENKWLLICSGILLVISIAFIVVYSFFVPTSSFDKMIGEKVKEVSVEYKDMPESIKAVDELFSFVGNKKLGKKYTATKNNQYGKITVYVAIDEKGQIIGIDGDVDQSIGAKLTKQYLRTFKGSNINEPKVNGEFTAPTVTFSLSTVDELLSDIGYASGFIVDTETIYTKLFGDNYVLDDITIIPNESVKSKKAVLVNGEWVANVYLVEKTGVYNGDEEAKISFNVILDVDGTILGYEEVEYKHSGGTFKKKVLDFFDELIAKKITVSEVVNYQTDITGATNSRNTLKALLVDLATFVETDVTKPLNKYEKVFGEGVIVSENDILNPTNSVKQHQSVTLDNAEVGSIYRLEKTGMYTDGSEGKIELEVMIDLENKIVAINVIEYGHTGARFKERTITFLNGLVENKTLVSAVNSQEDISGSTNSITLVKSMFSDLSILIGGK
ncbi:hypothetical protein [Haploplasma axanthum]|uniref:Uncharacterized protein n=1 Tax=Haploplasma axanthum TaxID=29552 RepID=A0A449BBD8_HAPAX|nr:hypothetical protein [Haploplasma axanthum]VEU79669.1 Uncharacterised protein [Haploplasma axanthum]